LTTLPIVERNGRGQPQKFLLILAVGLKFDRARVSTDVVVILLHLRGDGTRSLVRPVLPAGCPQHDQVSTLELLNAQDGKVRGLDQIAVGE